MAKVDTQRAAGLGEPYPEGATVEPTCDAYGRPVNVGGTGGGAAAVPSRASSEPETPTSYLEVSAAPCKVRSVHANFATAGSAYLWLFDAASLGDVSDANALRPWGDLIAAGANRILERDFPGAGYPCDAGLVVALSTSEQTFVASSETALFAVVTEA